MIPFNFSAAARVVRFAEYQFDAVYFRFRFEFFRDELLSIIEIDLSGDSSFSECPLQGIDRGRSIFMEVDFAFHAVAGTIVSESGDIDLSDPSDTELEGISLPHAVNMVTLEPFAGRLRFGFDSDEKSMFLKDAMNRSPGTG